MKVLVTGGAGYIGDCVVDNLLHDGHDVMVLDNLMYTESYMRPGVRFRRGNVADPGVINHISFYFNPDCVIHLAAIVGDGACAANPELTTSINEGASKLLVDRFRKKRFIFISTCSVFGDNSELLDEESPTKPLSLYAGTKLSAERYVTKIDNHVIFRLGTLFGLSTPFARMRADLVANVLTFKALEGKALTVFGGEQWRPLVHVLDVGRIIAESVSQTFTGKYILSYDNYKIIDVAQTISEITNAPIKITEAKFEDLRNYKVDTWRMKSVGLKPFIPLAEGIHEMVEVINEGRIKNVWCPSYHNAKYVKEVYSEAS